MEGTGFGPCDCSVGNGAGGSSSAGAGGGANAGRAGNAGAAATVTTNRIPFSIGTPCETDDDCLKEAGTGAALLTCLKQSSNDFAGGGPQGGYCTLPCQTSAACREVDVLSLCAGSTGSDSGYCTALCEPGLGNTPGQAPLKCGQDRAQACYPQNDTATLGLCLPVCTSDAACGPGRFCNPGDPSVCVDQKPAGGGIGAPCKTATQDTDCASKQCFVFGVSDDPANEGGFCTANCALLFEYGCGFDDTTPAGTVRDAACLGRLFADARALDIGFCYEMCDTNADCAQPDWVCSPLGNADLVDAFGRQGRCVPDAVAQILAGDAGTD